MTSLDAAWAIDRLSRTYWVPRLVLEAREHEAPDATGD